MSRWIRRRTVWWLANRHRVAWSLPAIGALLVSGLFVGLLTAWSPDRSERIYREVAATAFRRGDFENSRLASERLLQSKSEKRNDYAVNLALSLVGMGKRDEGIAILNSLATLDSSGDSRAHLYLAKALLAQTNGTAKTVAVAEAHLLHAIKMEPEMVEAHGLLGQIYVSSRNWDEAQTHLLKIVVQRPDAALLLAEISRARGDETGMHEWAVRAVKACSNLLAQARTDQSTWRVNLAKAHIMLKDYRVALTILETGWHKTGNRIYPPVIGDTYSAWLHDVKRNSPHSPEIRLQLIQQGLRFAPHHEFLLQELIDLTHLKTSEADAARSMLTRLLAERGDFPILHFCLGCDAWERGAATEAGEHFAVAFAQAPHLPHVANNMAMVLASGAHPDFNRALSIIQPVIEKFPGNPNFRDTRGLILVQLGRYLEGVKDLEFALPSLASKTNAHRLLAQAYGALGLKDLSDEHERLASSKP